MFQAVTINPRSIDIDVGQIAEALVYYSGVNVVCPRGVLAPLIQKFGYENLVRAIDEGLLTLSYESNMYSVQTVDRPFKLHSFGIGKLARTADGKKIRNPADDMEHALQKAFGKSRETQNMARELARRANIRDAQNGIVELARTVATDVQFMKEAIRAIASDMRPHDTRTRALDINVLDTGQGISISSSVPLEAFGTSGAGALAKILSMSEEIWHAGTVESDLWMSELESRLMQLRTTTILARRRHREGEVTHFNTTQFDGRSFREVINNGERSISDILQLVERDETRKFKQWLASKPDDASLIREYDRAVFSEGWTRTLPAKLSKIAVFTGLGFAADVALGSQGIPPIAGAAIGAVAGTGLNLGDEFLLPKLLGGWKPNQFIEGPAADFVQRADLRDRTGKG